VVLLASCGAAPAREPTWRRVRSAKDAIVRALEIRGRDCSLEALAEIPPRAWAVGLDGPWLVHLVCGLGAYQPVGELIRVQPDGAAAVVPLPLLDEGGAPTSSLDVGEVEVDLETRTLTESARFRGLGDCGRRVRARIEPDGGLTLIEHREQACSDVEATEHVTDRDRWPLRSPRPTP
jgi:hypothetical protein